MTQMLDDVLTLGRAESGRLGFNPTPSNIIQFCQSLVEELKLGQGREHIITFTHAEVSQEVRFDEKLLRHILSNLLSNAVKYSPKGSTITFHVTCEADKIIFRIQDAGIGIPLEDQKTLFDSFQRGKNVGNIPGTGLGLAIVKRSVDLHGGRIALHSEVGMGTEFTVMIPTDEKGRASYESY
ncbi:MAG: HAMP domain-containing histidine kinase [Coleofasciculaceae cyanobacterium SM2_3_26]|nr:HAMP domain-containing histidine kinase [Coleofasciculaceae cyanobacterium SM2_3_26]